MCSGVVWYVFWVVLVRLGVVWGPGVRGSGPVDMGCAVRFATDLASGSTGLRGKSRL